MFAAPREVTTTRHAAVKSLTPQSHDERHRTPVSSGTRLDTLPDEILSLIFEQLDSFILPPLSKRLLPFHRSQLYRNVTLNLPQFRLFRRIVDSARYLRPLVEILTFNFNFEFSPSGVQYFSDPSPDMIRDFRSLLPSLKEFNFRVDDVFATENYPKLSDFENNPRLEKIKIKSWFDEEEEGDDIFDSSVLRNRGEGYPTEQAEGLYLSEFLPEVIVELKRNSPESFGLRYFSASTTECEIHQVLKTIPLSHLELVVFTHKVHLDDLLPCIGFPPLLTHLSLFSFDIVFSTTAQKTELLLRFPNLTHLSLGGTSLPTSPQFYDSLRQLPLEYLHFGPHSFVHVQSIINLIIDTSKPRLSSLKRLVLDNIDARAPSAEEEEHARPKDWVFPQWTVESSVFKVRKLKNLAMGLGIEIDGTTFRGLEVVDSAAYQAALRRGDTGGETTEEEEEEEETADEADNGEQGRVGEEDDYFPYDPQLAHIQRCGCHRHWIKCAELEQERFSRYRTWYPNT